MLRHLLRLQLALWQRPLTPEVGIYRAWVKALIEEMRQER